jgi:hypothetical protein
MYSVIIQRQEDHPFNSGWWRFSRPVHRMMVEPPQISENTRWRYGSAAEAAEDQSKWDAQHPRG